jgi:hypothetical protein
VEEVINLEYTPPEKGYGMTEQDKDAIIGKAVRERTEASQEVSMLRAKLREIGTRYRQLATEIESRPEMVNWPGESMDSRFANSRFLLQIAGWTDLPSVMELVRQLRAAIIRESDAERQLTQLGIPPR